MLGVDTRDAGQQHPGGAGLGCGAYGRDGAFGVGRAGGDLGGEGQFGRPGGDGQLMAVDEFLGLERARVQQSRDCGDQQERGDEDTRRRSAGAGPAGAGVPSGP
ncbi:hypothetical protein GCM10010339_47140 [Streptomyces alanosinicus]|uniref:Uncharacterized protein n=1 Tax=Streptomyces alanosinicus TaxID=68171 RepID=A0A918YKN0_9ACTN|nr:hypothetical protein GCM10010339_47140 [Streptomyces alanosinicus]